MLRRWIPLVALGCLAALAPAPLEAACSNTADVVEDVWDAYERYAREAGCMAPIKGPAKWQACALERPLGRTLRLIDQMIGWWNSAAGNGWATLGHRNLGIEPEEGQLVGTTGRLFVGLAPTNSGRVTVELDRRSGNGRTQVEICAHRRHQRPESLMTEIVDPSRRDRWTWAFEHLEDAIVTVHLDGRSVANRFGYRLQLRAEPIRWDLGPVEGFADLHVHQAAELGFGGNSYWGSHTGNASAALDGCGWVESLEDVVTSGRLASLHGLLPLNVGVGEGEFRHGQGAPNFTSWPHWNDIAHQQAHADRLREAHEQGLQLVVVSAVNNEYLCNILKAIYPRPGDHLGCRDMENVERQIEAFVQFDEDHDWYEIAVDPWHARKIIHEGKLAAVVSLEASHLFPPDEGDFIAQLDELRALGLRTLQPVHETDSRFAGAAPHRFIFEAMQKFKFPLRSPNPFQGFRLDANGKNSVGLTRDGRALIQEMAKRGMLVDVSHMSERAKADTHSIFTGELACPFYESHSRFTAVLPPAEAARQQEFATTDAQIAMIREAGGMVGVRTGPNPMLDLGSIPGQRRSTVANNCDGSTRSYAQLIEYGERKGVAMAFGSDINGNTNQLAPRFGAEACAAAPDDATRRRQSGAQGNPPNGNAFHTAGFAHMGALPAVLADLERLGTPGTQRLRGSAEAFLQMWERAYSPRCQQASIGESGLTGCDSDADCPDGLFCPAGVGQRTCKPQNPDGVLCTSNRQCLGGGCNVVCYTPNSKNMGQSCNVNAECKEGKCSSELWGTVNGKCVCDGDEDCSSGQFCFKGFATIGTNECRAKIADGQLCDQSDKCQSGHCNVVCYTPRSKGMGQSCNLNAECREGKCSAELWGAVNGECVCEDDRDCPNGFCDTGTLSVGENKCKPFKALGEACSRGAQCRSGCCKLNWGKVQCRPADKCN
ncbi:MAG TPA: membrane dipeptidase [Thermoanaerobaculia bacterium]|nr:membrane dipeptidase [Thermoanaerobaculia bacterium]